MRPLPKLNSINRDFWTGGESGELRIYCCNDCGTFIHPPKPVCSGCLSDNVNPKAVSGKGVVDTYTINHQKWHPKMEVPFVVARVALEDAPGVIITSNIVGCEVEDVEFGDKVKVVFEKHDDVFIPLFEKAE